MKYVIGIGILVLCAGLLYGAYQYYEYREYRPYVEESETYRLPADALVESVPVAPTETATSETDVPTVESRRISRDEIATHAGRASCWSSIDGMVYDLTSWIDRHPGGASRILAICGTDGSASFGRKHGGQQNAESALEAFKIGILAP